MGGGGGWASQVLPLLGDGQRLSHAEGGAQHVLAIFTRVFEVIAMLKGGAKVCTLSQGGRGGEK